jgi:hypothetical protein
MTNDRNDRKDGAGSATDRAEVTDTSNTQPGHTGAGQEAGRGDVPSKHPTEHQSNYGGGGANGGSDRS